MNRCAAFFLPLAATLCLSSAAFAAGDAVLVQSTCERWLGTDYAGHPAYDLIAQIIQDPSTEGFVGGAQAIQKLDLLKDVGKLVVPLLLIVGENDAGMLQPMNVLHEEINGAHLETIANAGHLPQLDDANKFNELLFDHVRRNKRVAV